MRVARLADCHLLTRMVDAVLLEWEGVLADTASARRDALLRALAEEGVRFGATDYEVHCAGRVARAAAVAALACLGRTDATLADLVALRATRAFAERLGKGFALLPGALEFMEQVQLGSRIAVVTTATRAETEFVLRLAELDGAVSTIVSADDELDPPSSPAMYERALEQLAGRRPVRRDHAVAIVPTAHALRAARLAGVRTVALDVPAHVAVDADGAVDTLRGLSLLDLAGLSGLGAVERQS